MKALQALRQVPGPRHALVFSLFACSQVDGEPRICAPGEAVDLPAEVRESSGIAASRANPGLLWTHNDSGDDAVLYAVDAGGRLRGNPRVAGAENVDWEDIAVGTCPSGSCIYIADTGDNDEDREDAIVYRVPEPDATSPQTVQAERFPIRFPNGARDVESIFVSADGDVYLISKGRHSAPAVYRFRPGATDEAVTAEQIQLLGNAAFVLPSDFITGADALADGTVAVRSYATLRFYEITDRGLVPAAREPVNLADLGEEQGEGVAFIDERTIVFSSEGRGDRRASMIRLQCDG